MTHHKTISGVRIAYTDQGSGTPILMMHGNPDSRHSWEPMFAEIGEGFRMIAPDFPGFGNSQPLPDQVDFGPEYFAEFWNEFVNAVVPEGKVHVVVHDFGGPWLLPWVATYPDRVQSLTVINSPFHRDYPWHGWAKIWQTPVLGELALFFTTRSILRREMRLHAPGVPLDQVDAAYDRMHRTMRKTVLRSYRAFKRPDVILSNWEEKLQTALSHFPVCVLWGDQDPYIPARYADRYQTQAHHFPEYGHWIHLQSPALVAEKLKTFMCEQSEN